MYIFYIQMLESLKEFFNTLQPFAFFASYIIEMYIFAE